MCRFIETICFEKGGYPLLDLHQKRLNKAFIAHFPGTKPHDLKTLLPTIDSNTKQKVRVVYDAIKANVEWSEYVPRILKTIRLIKDDHIEYTHKYEDRSELKALYDQRKDSDEILIIRNGLVTDSFYANPAFWDGDHWYVPKSYLLNGVRRQFLIENGQIIEREIKLSDVGSFEKISLINALSELGDYEVSIRDLVS